MEHRSLVSGLVRQGIALGDIEKLLRYIFSSILRFTVPCSGTGTITEEFIDIITPYYLSIYESFVSYPSQKIQGNNSNFLHFRHHSRKFYCRVILRVSILQKFRVENSYKKPDFTFL